MSNRQTARLAFTCLGIYALIQCVPVVSSLSWTLGDFIFRELWARQHAAQFYRYPSPITPVWSVVFRALPLVLYCLAGTTLIIRSGWLADRVFRVENYATDDERMRFQHAFVYSCIGVTLFIFGLRNLALVGVTFWETLFRVGVRWDYFWGDFKYDIIGSVFYLGLGSLLFFKAHWLMHFWSRVRARSLRHRAALCANCGYDLTGNTSGRCPECGAQLVIAAQPPRPCCSAMNR